MAAATAARFAMGPIAKGLMKFLSPGKMNALEATMRFGPDLGFGLMAAAQTPGDVVDKAIAFGTTAAPSVLGGLGAGGTARAIGSRMNVKPKDLEQLVGLADMAGSIGGDFVGMPVGDMLMRGKDSLAGGEGETPFERLGREQQESMREQMEASILQQYGMMPGTRYDDYLSQLGLAG